MLGSLAARASGLLPVDALGGSQGSGPGIEEASGAGPSFERVAPCLLPEQQHVSEAVCPSQTTAQRDSSGSSLEHLLSCGLLPLLHAGCAHTLPVPIQVKSVCVAGPRYWPQLVEGPALRALYATRTLYVQRKAGALPYADDPTGAPVAASYAEGTACLQRGLHSLRLPSRDAAHTNARQIECCRRALAAVANVPCQGQLR